jgi:para-aminobenzoate synthetase/4-amino-4-deoxychorismate lyase
MNSAGICTITSSRIQTDTPSIPKVRLWPVPIHSSDVWLQHKTTRRILYDRALALAEKAGCVDAVFQNERGMVTEGAIHSILVRSGHIWRTPPLEAGILPGVFRQHLLRIRPEIREEDIHVGELSEADEIYLMNAVRGLRRVELQKEMLRL